MYENPFISKNSYIFIYETPFIYEGPIYETAEVGRLLPYLLSVVHRRARVFGGGAERRRVEERGRQVLVGVVGRGRREGVVRSLLLHGGLVAALVAVVGLLVGLLWLAEGLVGLRVEVVAGLGVGGVGLGAEVVAGLGVGSVRLLVAVALLVVWLERLLAVETHALEAVVAVVCKRIRRHSRPWKEARPFTPKRGREGTISQLQNTKSSSGTTLTSFCGKLLRKENTYQFKESACVRQRGKQGKLPKFICF